MSFVVVRADQGMVFHSSRARNDGLRWTRADPTWTELDVMNYDVVEEGIPSMVASR